MTDNVEEVTPEKKRGRGRPRVTEPAEKKAVAYVEPERAEALVKETTTTTTTLDQVVLYVSHPIYWPGMGRLNKGYNVVNSKIANEYIDRGWARMVPPEEVARAYGV